MVHKSTFTPFPAPIGRVFPKEFIGNVGSDKFNVIRISHFADNVQMDCCLFRQCCRAADQDTLGFWVALNDPPCQDSFNHMCTVKALLQGMKHGMRFDEVLACLYLLTNGFNVQAVRPRAEFERYHTFVVLSANLLHLHRADLELRDLRLRIEGGVGEEVGGGFGEVEGGEDQAGFHAVGDLRPWPGSRRGGRRPSSSRRRRCARCAASFGVDLDQRLGVHRLQAAGAVRHLAAVPVVEHAAGGEHQRDNRRRAARRAAHDRRPRSGPGRG